MIYEKCSVWTFKRVPILHPEHSFGFIYIITLQGIFKWIGYRSTCLNYIISNIFHICFKGILVLMPFHNLYDVQ